MHDFLLVAALILIISAPTLFAMFSPSAKQRIQQ